MEINDKIITSIIQQNSKTLQVLDLSGCSGITYESIQNISHLDNLSEINFSWTSVRRTWAFILWYESTHESGTNDA